MRGAFAAKYFRSPSPANFDAVSLYLLNCSVLSGQNYDASGSGGGQVACAITPDVAPGNLMQYRPFAMTDNNNQAVALNETYTARIMISW